MALIPYPGDTLLAAVKKKWYASADLTALLVGGLYVNEVPETLAGQKVVLPYCYVENPQTNFKWTQGQPCYEVADVEFCLFAAGAASAELCRDTVRAVFDWCTLAYQDPARSSTYFQPLSMTLASEPVRYRDGQLIYRAHLAYEAWTDRTRDSLGLPH